MGKTIIIVLIVCALIGVSVSASLKGAEAGLKSVGLKDAAHRGPPDGHSPPPPGSFPGGRGGGPPPPTTTASSG